MKLKINLCLLTFLILPTLCLGRVIKVTYNTIGNPRQGYETIIKFVSDQNLPYYSKNEVGEINPKIFTINFRCVDDYKPHMNCVKVADNKRQCYSLKLTLQKIFDVETLTIWPSEDVVLHPITLSAKLEELFVLNGFQVTFKREIRREETSEFDYEWFLFKKD